MLEVGELDDVSEGVTDDEGVTDAESELVGDGVAETGEFVGVRLKDGEEVGLGLATELRLIE